MGIVLGLVGKPGSGKSEVRKILEKKHHFEVINSKVTLYAMSAELTGLPVEHFSDPAFKNGEFEGTPLREITGRIGYAVEELFGQDYLIRKSLENHKVHTRTKKNFVVDSLRMDQPILLQDEMFVVQVHGGKPVESSHPFDQWQGATNYYLSNDDDLEHLEVQVNSMLEYFGMML